MTSCCKSLRLERTQDRFKMRGGARLRGDFKVVHQPRSYAVNIVTTYRVL